MNEQNSALTLYWDASFAIAMRLKDRFPNETLEHVSLNDIYQWVIALPNFGDDPDLVNDDFLHAIYQDWYEEIDKP